jgi:N-acetylglutamate synthase-like GNAT family acetyltransferase
MMDLSLREATEGELAAIASVLQAAFGQQMVKKMEGGRAVVALLGGDLVGCVVYEPNDDHVYLGRLAVRAPHRQHGVGGALVAYVEERARQLGTPRVQLAVHGGESHLREWYEAAGYILVEECFFPGSDEPMYVVLEKDVSR